MKILSTPDPFLRHTAKKVTKIDQKTLDQIEEMFGLLKNSKDPKGVGLAATQVGIDKSIFVLLDGRKRQIFINPKITKKSLTMLSELYPKEDERWLEGCLSIPKIWGFVDRPYEVTVEYLAFDPKSKSSELKTIKKAFSDIESSYVQHEIDHLNGILFTDHILKQKGQIFQETKSGLHPISLV